LNGISLASLQTNKTRCGCRGLSTGYIRWTVCEIAQRLSEQRPASLPPLSVCLQVNVSGEAIEGRASSLAAAPALAQALTALPKLRLRGLMAIPAPSDDFVEQCRPFRLLRELSERLQANGLLLDTLSMGMSHDLEAAIAEGSTLVRIGTAIFGERNRA
jgi:pyridoxal phosphate enzyme (YggS family)